MYNLTSLEVEQAYSCGAFPWGFVCIGFIWSAFESGSAPGKIIYNSTWLSYQRAMKRACPASITSCQHTFNEVVLEYNQRRLSFWLTPGAWRGLPPTDGTELSRTRDRMASAAQRPCVHEDILRLFKGNQGKAPASGAPLEIDQTLCCVKLKQGTWEGPRCSPGNPPHDPQLFRQDSL